MDLRPDLFTGNVTRAVLDNGLTVLVKPMAETRAVALFARVQAGYFHESNDVAGLAHLTEHMWFKGSRNWPGETDLGRAVQGWGGVTNAGTIYDHTRYYMVVPETAWRDALPLMADAFTEPLFMEETLKREAEVVIEESHRKRDNAPALAYEEMLALAFTQHRIRRWRIGDDTVLRNIHRGQMLAFYESLYRPENIILSIAGPIDPSEGVDRVAAAFAHMPRGVLRKESGPEEPSLPGFRYQERRGDIGRALFTLGWKTPPSQDFREPAFGRFAALLAYGRSSRLARGALGPGRLASLHSCGNHSQEEVGIFVIQGEASEPERIAEAEQAVMDEVHAALTGPIDPREWERVGNRLRAELLFDQEEALGMAGMLAGWEARGDYRQADGAVRRLLAVTPEEAQTQVAPFFTAENTTLHRYLPLSGSPPPGEAEERAQALFRPPHLLDRAFRRDPPPQAPPLRPSPAAGSPSALPLPGGGILLHLPDPSLPVLAVKLCFRGGVAEEEAGQEGITEMAFRTALRGTQHQSADEIAGDFEFLGGEIHSGCSLESASFGFSLPVSQVPAAAQVLQQILSQPTFPSDEVEKERTLQAGELGRLDQSATALPSRLLRQALYGHHRLTLPTEGEPASLARLTSSDLGAWFARVVTPSRVVVATCGDADPEALQDLFSSLLALPPRPGIPLLFPPLTLVKEPSRNETVVERDRRQTAFHLGFPTVHRDHPDRFALRVLAAAVTGVSGRFGESLRTRQSLAYTVSVGAVSYRDGGYFYGYLACEAGKEPRARRAMEEEFAHLHHRGLTEEEVERAKRFLLGSHLLSHQRRAARRDEMLGFHLNGRPLDFAETSLSHLRAVTAEDVRRVCRDYLRPEEARFGVLRGRTPPPR